MHIDTVTITGHDTSELPKGHAYYDGGLHLVITNSDGLHYILRHELTDAEFAELNPTWANSIYYPEVAP